MPVDGTRRTIVQYDPTPVAWTWVVPFYGHPALQPGESIASFAAQADGGAWPTNPAIPAAIYGSTNLYLLNPEPTLTACTASDNEDGTGDVYNLTGTVEPSANGAGGYVQAGILDDGVTGGQPSLYATLTNPTDHPLYLQTITGTLTRFVGFVVTEPVGTPPPVTPPTTPPPPTNLPPEVIQRKLLEKANPGFNCEIEREQRPEDLVQLFLGDKISLTVDGVRGNLGIIGRSHVVTRLRLRWQARVQNAPEERITTTVTLEKIPGQLLGGAGTANADQDAAFDGGDMALFALWDTDGAGWGAGWAA
jgi:hypothetical protein